MISLNQFDLTNLMFLISYRSAFLDAILMILSFISVAFMFTLGFSDAIAIAIAPEPVPNSRILFKENIDVNFNAFSTNNSV